MCGSLGHICHRTSSRPHDGAAGKRCMSYTPCTASGMSGSHSPVPDPCPNKTGGLKFMDKERHSKSKTCRNTARHTHTDTHTGTDRENTGYEYNKLWTGTIIQFIVISLFLLKFSLRENYLSTNTSQLNIHRLTSLCFNQQNTWHYTTTQVSKSKQSNLNKALNAELCW